MKWSNLFIVLFVFILPLRIIEGQVEFGIKDCIDKVQLLIPGDVIEIKKKFVSERGFWEVELISESGSEVEFEIDLETGEWILIKSEDGEFDYEFTPITSVVSFQTAKKTIEQSLGRKILKWEFVQKKDKWEYGFWYLTKSGASQIKVDAESGEIISKSKRKGN